VTSQLDLFRDGPGKYQRPGDAALTQIVAARTVTSLTGTWRRRVFGAIRAVEGGLTDEEIQTALGLNPSTERPRRVELVERGMVEDSGARRMTRSGRSAVVWALTEAGRRVRV
jgi:predicted ArsR family transcriptional regulator